MHGYCRCVPLVRFWLWKYESTRRNFSQFVGRCSHRLRGRIDRPIVLLLENIFASRVGHPSHFYHIGEQFSRDYLQTIHVSDVQIHVQVSLMQCGGGVATAVVVSSLIFSC